MECPDPRGEEQLQKPFLYQRYHTVHTSLSLTFTYIHYVQLILRRWEVAGGWG